MSERIGQGRENAKIYMENHLDIMAEVNGKVRTHYGFDAASAGVADPEEQMNLSDQL
jgi:recA bacterial DNA recombination protein.